MMRTPSIARRIVVIGVGVVAVLLAAFDVLLFLTIRLSPQHDDRAVARLLVAEAFLTPLLIALAALLLHWIAEVATRPLDEIAARARLTTLGVRGERLQPDRPETRIGQMATAYDAMLDSLEGAVADANAAEAAAERALAEARLAELAAEQAERRTRKILDTAHEAFLVMDEDGLIEEWNREAERMFGWTRAEILGRRWDETLIPQDVRERLEADRATAGGPLWPYGTRTAEMVGVRRDGQRFPGGVTVWTTEHDGTRSFNAFVRDFTERQRAEEATTHLAAIVASSDRAMLSTDPRGTVLTWNAAAERMYGYRATEAVGQHLTALTIPKAEIDKFDETLDLIARGEVIQRDEVIRRRKDGSLFPVSVTISPLLDANGEIYGACSIARDMTEERRIAAQLDATLIALEAALDEARESEARTRRFLDDAAHQLRSPITSIRACAETLTRSITPEQRDDLIEGVCEESERASRLMAGLLRTARLGHEGVYRTQPTDVLALCEKEAERGRRESPHLEITTTSGGPPPIKPWLPADAVGEVLANLVDNARRHASSRIEIRHVACDQGVELQVVDDGPGLPDDSVESAFQRFVSLDGAGGSGLGLAIGRELARAVGGDLTYEDRAFVLRLPASLGPPVERRARPRGCDPRHLDAVGPSRR